MNEFYSNNSHMNGIEKPVSLLNVFNTLFRHKGVVLTFFIAAVVIGSGVTFLLPPVYKGSAKLLLEREPESEKALLFRMNLPDGEGRYDGIETEIDLIESHPVAVQGVRERELDQWKGDKKPVSEAGRKRMLIISLTR